MSDSRNPPPEAGPSPRSMRLLPAAPHPAHEGTPPSQPTVCWGFASILPSRGRRLSLWVA
jgi:hypothetical protein